MTNEQTVQQFYIAYYGRPAEPAGLEHWTEKLEAGAPLSQLVARFGAPDNPEFVRIYGVDPDAESFLTEVYENVLNRAPDAKGLGYWTGVYDGLIADGATPEAARAEMVIRLVNGIQTGGQRDQDTWANKIALAEETTALAETLPADDVATLLRSASNQLDNPDINTDAGLAAASQAVQDTYDDLTVGSFALTVNSPTVTEGDTGTKEMVFTLTLNEAPTDSAVTVNYATLDTGTAAPNDDFLPEVGQVTFGIGQTEATVSVTILGDTAVEGNETVNVQFTGARLTVPVTATGTIVDDDERLYTLSSDAPSVTEGDSGSKQMVFTLTLDEAPNEAVVVNYKTLATGSAIPNDDFLPEAGQVTFLAGQTEATVSVTVLGDTDAEVDETVQIEFTGAKLVGPVVATGTIVNDDEEVFALAVDSPSVTEGDSGSKEMVFTLTLNEAPSEAVTVNYETTSGGTATPGDDFVPEAGQVTFAAGQTEATVSVAIIGDTGVEANETVQIDFSGPKLAAPVTATGTIINDDDPIFTLSSDAPRITEGDGPVNKQLVFTLMLDQAPTEPVAVNYQTLTSGTAVPGDDFVPAAGQVVFNAGQMTATVGIEIIGELDLEADETVQVEFSGPRLSAPVTATGTIENDDAPPVIYTLTSNAPTVIEGDAGTRELVYELELDSVPPAPVTISYETLSTGSATPGTDFVPAMGEITFAAGEQTAQLAVTVNGDTLIEPDETVDVLFTGAQLAGDVTATGTIFNDEQVFELTVSDPSVVEGDAGSSSFLSFKLELDEVPQQPVTVIATTNGGTATMGSDYTPFSGPVTFAAGQTTAFVNIAVSGDNLAEGDETVQLTVTGERITNGPVSSTGTIVDDDQPTYDLSANSTSVDEGGTVIFTLATTNVAEGSVFTYQISGGVSAADIVGGQLTGTAQVDALGNAVIPVSLTADAELEGPEDLTLSIVGIPPAMATVTVNDTSTPGDFVLTQSIDNLPAYQGSAQDDTYQAPLVPNEGTGLENIPTQTLQSWDVLDGGGGTNELFAALNGTNEQTSVVGVAITAAAAFFGVPPDELEALVTAPTISNIQNLWLESTQTPLIPDALLPATDVPKFFDMTNVSDVEQLWNNGSSSDLFVYEIPDPVTLGLKDVKPGVRYEVFYQADALGADPAAAQTVVMDGAGTIDDELLVPCTPTAGELDDAANGADRVQLVINTAGGTDMITQLDLSVLSGDNNVRLGAAGETDIETLNVTGTDSDSRLLLTEGNAFSDMQMVAASGFAGDLLLDISGQTRDAGDPDGLQSVMLSAGNDWLRIDEAQLLGAAPAGLATLSGGDGTDRLEVVLPLVSDPTNWDFSAVSGFELLELDKGDGFDVTGDLSVDLSATAFTSLIADADFRFTDAVTLTLETSAAFDQAVLQGPVTTVTGGAATLAIDGATDLTVDVVGGIGAGLVGGQDGDVTLDLGTVETFVLNAANDVTANVAGDNLVEATLNIVPDCASPAMSDHTVAIGDLTADALETLTINLGDDGTLLGPVAGSSTSLETVRVTGGEDSDFFLAFGPPTSALTMLDLSGYTGDAVGNPVPPVPGPLDGGIVNMAGSTFADDLEILVGVGDFLFTLNDTAGEANREEFVFDSDGIGQVAIENFQGAAGFGNFDILDFSNIVGIESIADLNANNVLYDGVASLEITAGDGQFDGSVVLVGITVADLSPGLGDGIIT